MIPSRRPHPPAQEGFILIEVLVSALILAIVAGAVLTLITATTRSAASERNHSTAYALAQEDQARLRTMRIADLNRKSETREVTVGGTSFTVESEGVFVNNKTGTPSCTEGHDSADYVEITSRVSGPGLLNPVSLQSVVSPTSGSLDPSHGTLAVQVNNAAGEPISGVSIEGSGSRAFGGSTEASGCANFADLPSGNYAVKASAGGLITPTGETTWTKEQVGVPASGTQQLILHFDTPGSVTANFVYLEPGTGALTPAPVNAMELFNAENEGTAVTFGTPGGARASTLKDASVYPFKTPYAVYAGSCASNNPDPESKGVNAAAIANVEVEPGGTVEPTIQVPALDLAATYNGAPVAGAKVVVTDTRCKYNSVNLKRVFYTDEAGHIAPGLTGTSQAVGLPFGTYDICVSKLIGAYYRRAEASNVSVKSLGSAASTSLGLSGYHSSPCS